MHTIAAILLSSVLLLGLVGITIAQAQTFDITTEQAGQGEAVITVQLATNNTVVIPPNGTIIEVPGNITQIDNNTVVVAPDNETVTELPGNVTVITPPEPEPCSCPPVQNVTEEQGPISPVIVQPAPGQQVITENGTELVANDSQEEPVPFPEPEPAPDTGGNDTATGGNETGDTQTGNSNDTGLAPTAFQQDIPWWQA